MVYRFLIYFPSNYISTVQYALPCLNPCAVVRIIRALPFVVRCSTRSISEQVAVSCSPTPDCKVVGCGLSLVFSLVFFS